MWVSVGLSFVGGEKGDGGFERRYGQVPVSCPLRHKFRVGGKGTGRGRHYIIVR